MVNSVMLPEKYQSRRPDASYERTFSLPTVMISVRNSLRQITGVDHALTSSRTWRQF